MDSILNFKLPVEVNLILDVLVVGIAILCAWRGWRKGIIGGLCAILAVVVSFYGANLIASTYSSEFTGVVQPFANGIVDSVVGRVTGKETETSEDDEEGSSRSWTILVPLSAEEKNDTYSVAFSALRQVGFHEDVAAELAKSASEVASYVNSDLSDFLADKLSGVAAFVAVFIIAFILISILFAVVGNVLDLVFELPGIEFINRLLGLALGLVKAFCILQFFGFIARYAGLVLPEKAVQSTLFFKYFVDYNYLASYIGM